MNIESKIAQNQEELEDFLIFNIIGRKSITEIVEYNTLMSVLENIEQYIDESVDKYRLNIIKDEDEMFVITKEEYDDFITLEVHSLFEFDDDLKDYVIRDVESDIVYIEDMTYNTEDYFQEELEEAIYTDEVFNLYIEEEELENNTDECNCSECDENCDKETPMDILLDEYVERIQELGYIGCPHCLREALEELHIQSYKEGLTDEILMQNEISNDRLFGEDGLLN